MDSCSQEECRHVGQLADSVAACVDARTPCSTELLLALLKSCYSVGFCQVAPPSIEELDTFDTSGDALFDADFCRTLLLELKCEQQAENVDDARHETASTAAAAARFCLYPKAEHKKAVASFVKALRETAFVQQRAEKLQELRDRKQASKDFAEPAEDDEVIDILYDCIVKAVASILHRFGFPSSPLGFNAFLGAARACGYGDRIRASMTRVWHASQILEPLWISDLDKRCHADRKLIVAFSSLGSGVVRPEWRGTLAGDGFVVAHAMDAACSWFCTNPYTGDWDNGATWEMMLGTLCARYSHISFLGDSMGGSAALRFAHLATNAVIAFTPQIDLNGCPVSFRSDFTDERQSYLKEHILSSCDETKARIIIHVGRDTYDLEQTALLPGKTHIVHHDVDSHLVSMQLKAEGTLRYTVLSALRDVHDATPMEDTSSSWLLTTWHASCVAQNARQYGLCHVRSPLFPPDQISSLALAATERFAEVMAAVEKHRAESADGAGNDIRIDFAEAVERDGCRWDVRHRMQEPPFDTLIAAPPWQSTIDDLLGHTHHLLFSGMIVATSNKNSEANLSSGLISLRPRAMPCEACCTETWLTAGARDLKRSTGMFYHEVLLGEGVSDGEPQVGFLSEQFSIGDFDGDGVGDDAHGWAVDGVRHKVWHAGPKESPETWPRSWREGDILGCAVDIDGGSAIFSLNGEWVSSLVIAIDTFGASIFPAISMRGFFEMNISTTSWRYSPPAAGYQPWASGGCTSGAFARPSPPAKSQQWHRDGEPLWPHDAVGGPLPTHCVNVFLPLVDLDAKNGATEFLPGSHLWDKDVDADLRGRVQPEAAAGTALVFDYRTSHRGGGNVSGSDRVVLYFTYAAAWFWDHKNHRSTRSLFPAKRTNDADDT